MFERLSLLASWPAWATHLASTVATVGLFWLLARALRLVVVPWLVRLAKKTRTDTDDALVDEVRKRIGFWGVLVGLYVSLNYWPVDPNRGYVVGSRLIRAMAVASVTLGVAGVATRLAMTHGRRASVPVSGLTLNVIRVVVGIFGILTILSAFDVEIAPLLTALGVGGLALALALQDPLSNFFAGLSVTFAGSVGIGDYIKLDSGVEGYVADFTWRTTRLRQLGGNLVEVPNNKLAQAIVTNFTQPTPQTGLTVEWTVTVTSDVAKVERAALEVALGVVREVPGCVPGDAPAVRFQGFSDIGVRCAVVMKTQDFASQALIRHEIVKRIDERLKAEGIEIASIKR
jgi:small-conductance mechanosensitive channel